MTKRLSSIVLGLVLILNSSNAKPIQTTDSPVVVSVSADTVERYGIYELSVAHDDAPYANPWEDVKLSVQFTEPKGQATTVDGFYHGPNLWKVRFSPPYEGAWHWALQLTTPSESFTEAGTFITEPSQRPGFVRPHPTNPFRLVFENGSLFNAIGIGDCILDTDHSGSPLDNWGFDGEPRTSGQHEAGSTADMPTYLAAYGAPGAGFNLFRWSVDNCAFKLWETISTQGNRYLIQEGLWGDQLVRALRENGFRIWMTIFGFEPAFLSAAGNPEQREAVERYIDYVVARYGTYVDIWELMNEAEVPPEWIAFAAEHLRTVDPYDHPITISWERPQLPQIEINAPHWYERESEFESDLRTSQKISLAKRWGKPVVFGEQGNSVQNWDARSALRMRLRSWTAFFEEGVLVFWNSSFAKDYFAGAANLYIGPQEREYIRALQDFTADVNAQVERFTLTPSSHDVRAYGLRWPGQILGYFHHVSDHDKPVHTTVTLDMPRDGAVLWIDPATAEVLANAPVAAGVQTLETPEFVVDLALRIRLDPR